MGQFYSNPDNLELAYKTYYPRILAFVYHVLNDEEDAKDVIQQSFLTLLKYEGVQSVSFQGEMPQGNRSIKLNENASLDILIETIEENDKVTIQKANDTLIVMMSR